MSGTVISLRLNVRNSYIPEVKCPEVNIRNVNNVRKLISGMLIMSGTVMNQEA